MWTSAARRPIPAVVSVAVGGFTVWVASRSWGFPFASQSLARMWGLVVGLCLLWLIARPLWAGAGELFVARTVVLAYFALLFLGVAAVEELWLLKQAAWPLAAQSRLPSQALVRHAFWMALIAGAALTAGAFAVRRSNRPEPEMKRSGSWDELLVSATVLAAVGMFGALVVFAHTRQLALFSRNVDQFRYTQGSGIGYATLLEYELLLAACIAGAALLNGVRARGWALTLTLGCLGSLLALRAERTPVLLGVLTIGLVSVYGGRRFRRRTVLVAGVVLVALVVGLGASRLASEQAVPLDHRTMLVRAAFDLSPEFREQAWVYHIYPSQTPLLKGRAVAADLSALVPSRALRLGGIDKKAVYGDISHSYSATMTSLGLYPAGIAPLRVGVAGEMWADYGWGGLIVGGFLLGLLAAFVGRIAADTPLGKLRKAVATALLILALIMPFGSLLPLAVMLMVPLWLLSGAFARRFAIAGQSAPVVSAENR